MTGRLRIALILETSGGGSGRHVLDLARGLSACGQDVTVIWSPTRAQADFKAALASLTGVETHTLEMNRSVGLSDLKSLRALSALLRRLPKFDILHGHSSKAGALVRLLPRSLRGARIYTPHAFRTMDPELKAPGQQIYGLLERALAPRANRIIAVSAAERDHAVTRLGMSKNRVRCVVNGAYLPEGASRMAARAEMGLTEDEIAVGFIGRLDAQKDPLRFVGAIRHVAERVPELRGVVIGDGALRQEAEAAAEGAPVRFLGWRDGPALFPGLDLFCMTSRYEAMPYTLIEALHASMPIVTTAVGGAEETVIEGENGHILPLNSSAEAIGEALAGLAGAPAARMAMGTASRRLAQHRTVDVMVGETLELYAAALAGDV